MRKITILAVLLPFVVQAQNFEEVQTTMQNFYYSASDVADFDGDGYLDIVHNGAIDSDKDTNVDTSHNEIYRNNNGEMEFYGDLGLNATHLGDIKFIDFDNDGLLDIVSTGLSYNDIVNYKHYRFKNTGSGFELEAELPGKIYGNLDVFDFNHDGKQDYAINGTQYVEGTGFINQMDLYNNTENGFEKISNWMPGSQNSSFKLLDINNDQHLDMIAFGLDGDFEAYFHVYLNVEGELSLAQELPAVSNGDLAYADFNADGFMDFVAVGQDVDYNEFLGVYINDGQGIFEVNEISLEGLGLSSVDVGDLTNDGYYDFVVVGDDSSYNGWIKTFIFNPNDGSFSKAENTGLFNLGSNGDISLFDFDNDNHLDVLASGFDWEHEDMPSLTKLFRNLATDENQKPTAPTELSLIQEGNRLHFTWDGASDDKTPTEVLRYELKVGTSSGSSDIANYVVTTNSWFLDLEEVPENIFWSVKSIDASKVYSQSSEESELSIQEIGSTNEILVFPNPASHLIYVKGNNIKSVEMYDINGKRISIVLNSDQSINVAGFPKGLYVLKIYVNGKIETKKVLID